MGIFFSVGKATAIPLTKTMPKLSTILPLGVAAVAAGSLFLTQPASADAPAAGAPAMFEVTITNLTSNQVFSAPIVSSHNDLARMFEPGTVATPELQALAEDGDNSALLSALTANSDVLDVATYPANIIPGTSMTTVIEMDRFHDRLSIAGMLVTTNDAFFGVDSLTEMRDTDSAVFFAPVFDAGTEFNSEDCAYIPGPPCGNGGVHDPSPAEGFIHFSSGIHGTNSLAPETYDWGTYAARIEVRRI